MNSNHRPALPTMFCRLSLTTTHEVSETAAADQLPTVHEVAATTGLPSISEVISNRRSALFGHVARLHQDVPAHKASTATSTCLLVDHPTTSGNVVRADHERDGSTRSGRTMESPSGSVEACNESWPLRSNATALTGFAMTTTVRRTHKR